MIESYIQLAHDAMKKQNVQSITDDRAFSHMLLKVFHRQDYVDHVVTDGPNDGGIDFIYYNDDDSKLILAQSKYTTTLTANNVIAELQKMYSTYLNFKKHNTGLYNEVLKRELTNAIDQMPEDNSGLVEYHIYTKATDFDVNDVVKKIETKMSDFPTESVKLYDKDAIEDAIESLQQSVDVVKSHSIRIDKPNNVLSYESDSLSGIMCNVMSNSIVTLYNLYQNQGLFDLNIRRYIKNKLVDEAINKTLGNDRDNFWFLNNGIIIACEEYDISGNKITLMNFSIVNGGQTTQLIGEYKGKAQNEFAIPCKIVAVKDAKKAPELFNKIAQASNSQKPILPRDLRANSKEMKALADWMKNEKIFLEIKRGTASKKKNPAFNYSLKNDELGQMLLSFVHQQPGTARSGKKTIFDNSDFYGKLFRVNYQRDPDKRRFLLDLINVKAKYDALESAYKDLNDKTHTLSKSEMEILKNGRQTVIALMGLCYRLVNKQISMDQVLENQGSLSIDYFSYGPILSNYTKDDIDDKFELIVSTIITILSELYDKAYESEITSSVSNFMKTDSKYYESIVKKFVGYFKYAEGKNIMANWDIFKQE